VILPILDIIFHEIICIIKPVLLFL